MTGLLKPSPYLEVIVDGKLPKKQRSRREVDLPTEVAQQHEPDGDAVHKDKLPPVQLQNVKKDALLGEVCQDFYSVKNIVAVVTSWTSAWTCGSVTARTGQVRAIRRLAPYTSFWTDSR